MADKIQELCQEGINAGANEGNWDKAIGCFRTARRLLGKKASETLVKNLSACLNARAVEETNKAFKLLEEQHRSVFDKAVHGYGF